MSRTERIGHSSGEDARNGSSNDRISDTGSVRPAGHGAWCLVRAEDDESEPASEERLSSKHVESAAAPAEPALQEKRTADAPNLASLILSGYICIVQHICAIDSELCSSMKDGKCVVFRSSLDRAQLRPSSLLLLLKLEWSVSMKRRCETGNVRAVVGE